MKLERNQLYQARQACQDEERELGRTMARMEELCRNIRGSMAFIRNENRRRLAQAKTLMATQERQYRDAMLKLQRLEMGEAKKQSSGEHEEKGGMKGAGGQVMPENRQLEMQRQLVEEYAQEITRGCEDYLQTEREVQETEKRLIQQEKEAEQAMSAVRRPKENALRELKSLRQVFDRADALLRDYERVGDD